MFRTAATLLILAALPASGIPAPPSGPEPAVAARDLKVKLATLSADRKSVV